MMLTDDGGAAGLKLHTYYTLTCKQKEGFAIKRYVQPVTDKVTGDIHTGAASD